MRFVATGVLSLLGALLCLSATANAGVLVAVSKSQQQMAVIVDGEQVFRWPVSTGRRGYETPEGVFHGKSLNRIWFSRQYDMTPMPWSVFFHQGYALHGTAETRHLGHAVSHGCVRLDTDNAAILFALVSERGVEKTKVIVTERALPPLRKAAPALIAEIERGAHAWLAATTAQSGAPVVEAKPAEEQPVAADPDRAEQSKAADKTQADAAPQPVALPPVVPAPPAPQATASLPVVPPAPPATVQDVKLAEPALKPPPLPAPVAQQAPPPVPQIVQPPEAPRVEANLQDVRLPLPAPRHRAEPDTRTRGGTRYATARGGDAEVLRERAAWLRQLARKYGYEHW